MNEKEIIIERVKTSSLYKSAIENDLNEEEQNMLFDAAKELSINFEILAENLLKILKDKDASKKFNEALINSKH